MNRILTISAIAMFAVILGLSSLGPAMAKADTTICHFAEEETVLVDMDGDGIPETPVVELAHWMFLTLNNNGSTNGHLKNHGEDTNGDGVIDIPDFIAVDPADCQALIDG